MNITTVKRNGIFIIFPSRDEAPIKGEKLISVEERKNIKIEIKAEIPIQIVNRPKRIVVEKRCNSNRENVVARKKCIWCGESVFHNSQYCWDCYKYEHFESK